MPIKPENIDRYPPDWQQIRERILKRAGNRCEGSPAFPDCRAPNNWCRIKSTGTLVPPHHIVTVDGRPLLAPDEFTRIVLTIGHLDHTPENCDESNLRAWCQRCHLNYDAKHHAQTAYNTRRSGKAAGELF
jgi:hypothetical protein